MGKKFSLAACVIAATMSCAAAGHAAGLVNGSFENTSGFVDNGQNTMTLGGGSTTMTGWTVTGDALAWIGPRNPFGVSASDGGWFLDLTDYANGAPFGGVSQSVTTLVGASYSLTFDLGRFDDGGADPTVHVTAGSAFGDFTHVGPGSNLWAIQTFNFVAASSSTAITIQGSGGYSYIGLDNVSLVKTAGPPTVAVPEPATWAMMLVGFGGLGAALRRSRRMAPTVQA